MEFLGFEEGIPSGVGVGWERPSRRGVRESLSVLSRCAARLQSSLNNGRGQPGAEEKKGGKRGGKAPTRRRRCTSHWSAVARVASSLSATMRDRQPHIWTREEEPGGERKKGKKGRHTFAWTCLVACCRRLDGSRLFLRHALSSSSVIWVERSVR